MLTIDCEQGSPEWFEARIGRVTASRISDVLAKGKGGNEAVTRKDYKFEIVSEILTGKPSPPIPQNDAMRWGTEQEPFARAEYEIRSGLIVDTVGIVLHPRFPARAAASPDGIVSSNNQKLIEIKCPKTSTHISYLESGKIPTQYENQMMWQMICTEFKLCDFVSYDPRLDPNISMMIIPLNFDQQRADEIESEVIRFIMEIDDIVNKLKARK